MYEDMSTELFSMLITNKLFMSNYWRNSQKFPDSIIVIHYISIIELLYYLHYGTIHSMSFSHLCF